MKKKLAILTMVAGAALTLSACDFFAPKNAATEAPVGNVEEGNEQGLDGNLATEAGNDTGAETGNVSDNAATVVEDGVTANTVGGNAN